LLQSIRSALTAAGALLVGLAAWWLLAAPAAGLELGCPPTPSPGRGYPGPEPGPAVSYPAPRPACRVFLPLAARTDNGYPMPSAVPTATPRAPTATPIPAGSAAWPMFGHDAQHSGRSPFAAPARPSLRWSRPGGAATSPILGPDGVLYLAGQGWLAALGPDGAQRWTLPLEASGGEPALAPDGTLYVRTGRFGLSSALTAVDAARGRVRWTVEAPDSHYLGYATTIGPDDAVYFGAGAADGRGGWLYAFNGDGTLRWRVATGEYVEGSSPAVAPDGTVYLGSMGGALYAVRADGVLAWRREIAAPGSPGAGINSSPAVGPDGTVYVGGWDGFLHAFGPDGTPRWRAELGDAVLFSSPALAADGTVYVGAGERLLAVAPDGAVRWRATCLAGGLAASSPAVGADGTVLVQAAQTGPDGRALLCAYDGAGLLRWSHQTQAAGGTGPRVPSAAIGSDGTVYVEAPTGTLHALASAPSTTPTATPVCVPRLLSPEAGAVLDNGRDGVRSDDITWDFAWSACPGATRYQLYVIGPRAEYPAVDATIGGTTHHYACPGCYVVEGYRLGWAWRVRAGTDEGWGPWSGERLFDVEPANTDPRSAALIRAASSRPTRSRTGW
jgi:outer membrane protein assembly factor BamB